MRLHRFYIPQKIGIGNEIKVDSAELCNQLKRVFRLKTGDTIVVFDGSGSDYECRIADFGKDSITLDVQNVSRSRYTPTRQLRLYAAVVKKDNFEWIVEKATELGATHIIPVLAERSEKKNVNETRLKKIAVEASEQSGRGSVPEVMPLCSLQDALSQCVGAIYAFHTDGNPANNEGFKGDLSVFIGPEGGWSPQEIDLFTKSDARIICLGPHVLRAETAVIAALSVVQF